MIRFIIYLFETGLCLSLLYLAYWLFLRKETYFNFNRVFLVGSIILALSVPLLHLNFMVQKGGVFEDTAFGIAKIQNSYEEMIKFIDADFGLEPGSGRGSTYGEIGAEREPELDFFSNESEPVRPYQTENQLIKEGNTGKKSFSVIRIIGLIYICGVIYFLFRFLYLVIRLYLLAKRNGVTQQEGFRMVEMKEDISPFSFFRFLFINHGFFNESELENVLEHEKAHIMHRHSMDHLFAHGLAIFQWFNPMAWQLRNALKTTHEYIADRQVINRGFELFDYQSILLKQVIGYHSVELVNNFNLKPIKKRIAMMSKNRPGIPAKLKATLVIPFAIIVFFLFAEFTLVGAENQGMNVKSTLKNELTKKSFQGLWMQSSNDQFSKAVHFTKEIFSYSDGSVVNEYLWEYADGEIILYRQKGSKGIHLKVDEKGDQLAIWWNDSQSVIYSKSKADNTLDHYLGKQKLKIDLPFISQYRLMEGKVFKLCLGQDAHGGRAITFNGNIVKLAALSASVEKERSKYSKLDVSSLTAMFYIDKEMPMRAVVDIREELRKANALHVADAGYPHGTDHTISPLSYHAVALPRLLPPLDAKTLDKKEFKKIGGELFVINLSEKNTSPAEIDKKLKEFIFFAEKGKYVISLEYDKDIPYGQYIEMVDMIFKVVYSMRDQLAMQKYQMPYTQLGAGIQKEIRKVYPMALSESYSDN